MRNIIFLIDKNQKRNNEGFTIQEMIVALAVFAVVITMAMSAYMNLSNALSRAESLRTVNDNLSFAMDAMSSEIRYAKKGTVNITDGGSRIVFEDLNSGAQQIKISYYLDTDSETGFGEIRRVYDVDGAVGLPGLPKVLTSSNINVAGLNFESSSPGVNLLPIISISLDGKAGIRANDQVRFSLQTAVASWRTTSN